MFAAASLFLIGCASTPPAASVKRTDTPAYREATARIEASTTVLRELRESPDAPIPIAIAKTARCVAIVPKLVHAGVLVAARSGSGVYSCRVTTESAEVWSVPAFFTLSGASAGLQAGFEQTDLLMLATNESGENAFTQGHVQLGAGTSIAAGPVGRGAEASGSLSAAIVYYARSKGLFAGIDLSGTVIDSDEASMRSFYGDPRDFGALLHAPKAPPPPAELLREEMRRFTAATSSSPSPQ